MVEDKKILGVNVSNLILYYYKGLERLRSVGSMSNNHIWIYLPTLKDYIDSKSNSSSLEDYLFKIIKNIFLHEILIFHFFPL